MKLKFSCPKCNIPFVIESKYLIGKESLSCPNCGLEYPPEKFKDLKESMRLFESSKDAEVSFKQMGTVVANFKVSVCPDQTE